MDLVATRSKLQLLIHHQKTWVSPSERYTIVPDESRQTVAFGGNGNDASVPENDVKRMRI
uniref:Uncharacterized protein n=1 Tax=Populus trichocarpa TaxID=3694 RepID=A0A2K2ACN9_POPTR